MLNNAFMTFSSLWSYIIIVNFVAFIVYAIDKYKAVFGGYRVPEKILLLLAVFGGSYGAWLAMKIFHHKTQKFIFAKLVPVILLFETMLLVFSFGCEVS